MRTGTIAASHSGLGIRAEKARVFLVRLGISFKAHIIFFVLIAAYLLGLELVKYLAGIKADVGLMSLLVAFVMYYIPTTLLGIIILRFLHMIFYVRPEKPLLYLVRDIGSFITSPARLLNAIPMTLVLLWFLICFSTIKDAIPLINPFSWDKSFMELDRVLHFGYHPWQLLQPILGYWPVTLLLNIIYMMWLITIWVVWVWVAFADRQSELRLQYLIAYFLSWSIGGSMLAIVFSSAGPVYYANFVAGPDPFAPLISYLHETNEVVTLWAVKTQQFLWETYQSDNGSKFTAISAMPSMHNATALLFALLGWRVSRRAGIAASLFALAIFLGSIHLGWHYAIDAYLGFAIVAISWWISGRFARWYMTLPFVQRHSSNLEQENAIAGQGL